MDRMAKLSKHTRKISEKKLSVPNLIDKLYKLDKFNGETKNLTFKQYMVKFKEEYKAKVARLKNEFAQGREVLSEYLQNPWMNSNVGKLRLLPYMDSDGKRVRYLKEIMDFQDEKLQRRKLFDEFEAYTKGKEFEKLKSKVKLPSEESAVEEYKSDEKFARKFQ